LFNGLLERDIVFFDGAIGTMLQKRGLKPGERPDIMNITAPGTVEAAQRLYAEAGSDIINTNTFGANKKNLSGTGHSVEEVITAAVGIAKRAGSGKTLTALDIGPIGEFIQPFGALSFDESYEMYRQQAVAGEKAGADLAAIETMSDLFELKAAMLAVRENTKLPIFAMMTFDKSGRTFTGCRPESFAITAEGLGASAVGINCSLSPREIFPIAEKIAGSTNLPIIIKPNAGLPNAAGEYDIDAKEFVRQMEQFLSLGVKIVGGCCGTNPDYIRELYRVFNMRRPEARKTKRNDLICTPLHFADVKNLNYSRHLQSLTAEETIEAAVEQADAGAEILSVRLPEPISAEEAVNITGSIQSLTDRPLHIITDDMQALSAALRAVTGIAAVTRPGGLTNELREIAAKYGAYIAEFNEAK
jgi:5-methyltetrahydrofolate--homocysteine methyltransferase